MPSNIFYDEERGVYIDLGTGLDIPFARDTETNASIHNQSFHHDESDHLYALALASEPEPHAEEKYDHADTTSDDHALALSLAASESSFPPIPAPRRPSNTTAGGGNGRRSNPNTRDAVENELTRDIFNLNVNDNQAPPPGWGWEDWSLARALQGMEIEIATEGRQIDAFESSEKRASTFWQQLFTVSTLICVSQIVLVVVMLGMYGFTSQAQNPMIGPAPYVLVRFGAKEMTRMIIHHQWWRLITAIFVHAGIFHVLVDVFIQLRIGGYLELMWGSPQWIAIYFSSGVFGYMLSGIFAPDAIGMGSQGAIMGLVSAWSVWIIFRWHKVPAVYHKQRNCQLGTVILIIVVVIGLSFSPFSDWSTNVGGVIQGLLWGAVVLSHELDNIYTKWKVRIIAISISALSYTLAAVALSRVHVNDAFNEYFDANDHF